MHPRQMRETFRPVAPRLTYCMMAPMSVSPLSRTAAAISHGPVVAPAHFHAGLTVGQNDAGHGPTALAASSGPEATAVPTTASTQPIAVSLRRARNSAALPAGDGSERSRSSSTQAEISAAPTA